jgi:transposase-like protein
METFQNKVTSVTQDNQKVGNRKKLYFNQVCEMFSNGLSVKQIATTIDMDSSTIRRWLNESGLRKPTKKMTFRSGGKYAHLK